VGLACESASLRQVAKPFGTAATTVRAIDLRYRERWNATRRKAPRREIGLDEIYLGKQLKFIRVVSNLESGEPLWFGQERKQETLDEFFRTELTARQGNRFAAACVDMGRPFTNSIEHWARTVGSFTTNFTFCSMLVRPSMKCAGQSSSVRADEMRGAVKGKRWRLLTRWVNLDSHKRSS